MKDNFKKDVLVTVVGQFVVLIVTFIVNKIISLQLGPIGYTEFSIAKRTASVISYVMLMGLGIAIPRFLPFVREKNNFNAERKYLISAVIILLFSITLIMISSLLCKKNLSNIIFGNSGYENVIVSMLIFAFSTAISTLGISFYRALDKFYMYSIAQIILQLLMLLSTFVFGQYYSVLLMSWGVSTGTYGLIICLKIMKQENCFYLKNFTGLKKYIKKLLKYCVPRIPGELILFAYTVVPIILISHKIGIEKVTPFATGITINTMISPLFSFVGVVLLPLISKSLVNGSLEDSQKKIKKLGIIYSVLSVLGIMFVEIFPKFLISLAFSNEFLNDIYVVRIMVLSVFPNAIYLLLRNPIDAISEKAYNTVNLLISFLILNVMIIFSNSTYVYAFSFFIAYFVLGVLSVSTWIHCCKQQATNNFL